jgi:hypothetical protein
MSFTSDIGAHRRHQPVGDGAHLGLEALDQLSEARHRRVVGPLVRALEAQVGRLDVWVTRVEFGPHVDLFAVVDPVVGELGAHAFPAPEPRRVHLVDRRLRLLRQGEERTQRGEVRVEERRVDAVVDEAEEPDLVTDRSQPIGERLTIVVTTSVPFGERHDRDLLERHVPHRTDAARSIGRQRWRAGAARPDGHIDRIGRP